MPTLAVIAGPNGSGKSTITRYLDFEGKDRLLDPDAIARRIDPVDPGRAAVTAGREAIRRTREYIALVSVSELKPPCPAMGWWRPCDKLSKLGSASIFPTFVWEIPSSTCSELASGYGRVGTMFRQWTSGGAINAVFRSFPVRCASRMKRRFSKMLMTNPYYF